VVYERLKGSSVAGLPPFIEASGGGDGGPAAPEVADHRFILAMSVQRRARGSTVVESTMDITGWLREQLEEASPDLLRAMVQEFAEALMGAEADTLCGARYGERTPQRVNRRSGYRERGCDTRVGSIELAVPKLRAGSYLPDWLLQPRRRVEQAFVSVIAEAYLACVSARRVENLVQELGSSVCRRARSRARPSRPIGSSRTSARGRLRAPVPLPRPDALEVKSREGGRTVNAASCTRSPSIGTAPASRSASMSSRKRTAPHGSPSCARSSPAASPE
jgi:hypothetical protein